MKAAPIAKAALLLLVLCRQAAAEDRVFFGNLHSHTSYSDGSGKPADAYTYARTKGKLDFLLISEHNHASAENGASADRRDGILIAKDHSLYTGPKAAALIPAAKSATKANFLALYGQEFSTISSGNHVNVFDVPKVIDVPNGDFKDLVRWLGENKDSGGQPAIVQLNHPAEYNEADNEEYGRDDFASATEWLAQFGGHVSLAELVVGPAMAKPTDTDKTPRVMEKDYLDLLNIGFKVAPTADQDNHYKTWGTSSNARTGVVADALTKEKILAALRARHAYATEDPTLRIVVRMGGGLAGDVVASPALNSEIPIDISIVDDDEPVADYEVEVYSDKGPGGDVAKVIDTVKIHGNTATPAKIEDIRFTGTGQYVFLKIRQLEDEGNGDRAWIAPVWFATAGSPTPSPPTIAGAPAATGKEVASKKSEVYHLSDECIDAKRIKQENRLMGELAKNGRRLHTGCPRKQE